MSGGPEERQLSVRLPSDLVRRLKSVAAREGKTVTEIIEGFVSAYVAAREAGDG